MASSRKICRDFARNGTCKFKNCRFLHTKNDQVVGGPSSRPSSTRDMSNSERDLRAWKLSIPTDTKFALSRERLTSIFERATQLLDTDVGVRPAIVQKLSEENGLRCITMAIEQNLEQLLADTKEVLFKNQIFPILQIVSHPEVVQSLILEQALGTIYNILYGIGGARASKLLNFCLDVLTNCTKGPVTSEWLATSIFVFSRIVDLNSTAHVQDSLRACANRFQQIFSAWVRDEPDNCLDESRAYLERLLRRFDVGVSLPQLINSKVTIRPTATGSFAIKHDPPGGRHDNDWADFCDISILPTYGEISSRRIEYLPTHDPSQWHLDGLHGLLDRNFRLLREDTIGLLRDAIHNELQLSGLRSKRKNQQRTNVYQGAKIVKLGFHNKDGLQFQLSFLQPMPVVQMTTEARKRWWETSKRLQPGALVCLVVHGGFTLFCTVISPQVRPFKQQEPDGFKWRQTDSGCLWKDPGKGAVYLQPTTMNERSIYLIWKMYTEKSPLVVLVEFPGVLLAAFEPTLKALQLMKKGDSVPFSDFLIPHQLSTGAQTVVPPPRYASERGFRFNLRCLTNDDTDFYFDVGQLPDLHKLCENSSLDYAQASALVNTLQRQVGLIQGPPGTGKSYTGIALIKVLLANKKFARRGLGPIICVTFTNHALDQLLESLLQKNVTKQIIRIGGQSKSESLKPYNLRDLAAKIDKTKVEKSSLWTCHTSLEQNEKEFYQSGFQDRISPTRVMMHLRKNHSWHYKQLFGKDAEGFQTKLDCNPGKLLDRWCKSGSKSLGEQIRGLEQLETTSVFEMSRRERESLYAQWENEVRLDGQSKLTALCLSHSEDRDNLNRIRNELDLRCLNQADVIGVTTTGLAKNINVLRRLQSKVLVCEEAGEVLEPHLLTALIPSLEHAIFIGDHFQLRPQVQNYELSRENKNGGEKFSFDVSLFERLVEKDSSMGCGLPYSTLRTQRRMHPSIAQLIRETLYPRLQDAPSVSDYPMVKGLRKRLFWLDHCEPEGAQSNEEAAATSNWNEYEVEMTTALVNHLVRQGEYSSGEIAVLTPYLGQLQRLRRKLGESYAITLGDRDEEDFNKAGLEENENQDSTPMAVKAPLIESLRVATIDNFQGEEARIVVISLVRSNSQNKCGFLRTSNRINVLLSRAKHGMYIIGNSTTSEHVSMWAHVLEILKREDNIGTELQLQCPRHPATVIGVSKPEDFPRVSPEGGCDLRCIDRLPCGHACVQKCHSEVLHNAVYCLEPCQRPRRGCSHPCPKKCGDKCPSNCTVTIIDANRKLACGHSALALPCWQSQDLSTVRCPEIVEKTVPSCQHKVKVECHVDVSSDYRCTVQCRADLPCGHSCKEQCYKCVTIAESGNIVTDHGKCGQKCGRNYTTCAHTCATACHDEEPCPPCQSPCEVECGHSKCSQKCSEPCVPCAEEECLSSCPHSTCTMPCAAPCNHVPCSLRCEKQLACGHQCPSVCGEICPSERFCQICCSPDIKKYPVDFICGDEYQDINLDDNPCIFPKCGHFLAIDNMDAQMDMAKYYELDEARKPSRISSSSKPFSIDDIKTCSICRGPLRSIARYGRLVRRALLDESTKKLILFLNREYIPLAQEVPRRIHEIQTMGAKHLTPWPESIELKGDREILISTMKGLISTLYPGRWKGILSLRQRLAKYQKQVAIEEQPYRRVHQLVENKRSLAGTGDSFGFGSEVLQTKGTLQGWTLSLRLDIALLADFLELRRAYLSSGTNQLNIDLSRMRCECETLIKDASELSRVSHQTEGYIFLAQLHAFERSHTASSTETATHHLLQATNAIDAAKSLCVRYPGQTEGLKAEIEETEKLLRGSTFYTAVTNEERMAVIAAMAREFRGTGHWYYCPNGHPFTIGECGMAMERSVCPECGATVGGQNHRAVEGVTHAMDMETAFTDLRLH